jgi:RNA polymerase sigma-70 factor, ECF subfamily
MRSPTDSEGFEKLYEQYAGQVLSYCLRRSSDGTAEDALSETFAIAWRRRDAIPSEPLPWLYGVARRVLANQRRAAGRQGRVTRRLAQDAPAADFTETAARELKPILAALSRLRDNDRELLMLVAWEGLTPADAAKVLGVTALACRLRLLRARRRLEQLMSDSPEQPAQSVRPGTKEARP